MRVCLFWDSGNECIPSVCKIKATDADEEESKDDVTDTCEGILCTHIRCLQRVCVCVETNICYACIPHAYAFDVRVVECLEEKNIVKDAQNDEEHYIVF